MSKIKNCGLDQYGAEPFEQQQFGTGGAESTMELSGVSSIKRLQNDPVYSYTSECFF